MNTSVNLFYLNFWCPLFLSYLSVPYVKSLLPANSKWKDISIGLAKNWWDKASSSERSFSPQPNSIMVFNNWGKNSAGHVAYVVSVNGNEVTVNHSNFDCKCKPTIDTFIMDNGNQTAYKSGGKTPYPVRGFVLLSAQSQPPMPSPVSKPKSSQSYHIRITNIDDEGVCFVNGQKVATAGYYGDTGWVDVTNKLHRGDNKIEFKVKNNKGGYTYHFAFKENNNLQWEKRCGEVGREGCKEHLPKGKVLTKKFTWRIN
ncbi:MAG: CHAP domain-containing protein [Nitrospirota bacterium]